MTDAPQTPTPPQPPAQPPPKPDLTMAWLPHLLLVLTWWLGPLIIWLIKKDEDKLAAFHGKQATIFGVAATVACFTICLAPFAWVAVLVYGIIATVNTYQGQPFKYYFIADKFCADEFAAAYPDLAAQQQAQQPSQEQPPQQPEPPAGA